MHAFAAKNLAAKIVAKEVVCFLDVAMVVYHYQYPAGCYLLLPAATTSATLQLLHFCYSSAANPSVMLTLLTPNPLNLLYYLTPNALNLLYYKPTNKQLRHQQLRHQQHEQTTTTTHEQTQHGQQSS